MVDWFLLCGYALLSLVRMTAAFIISLLFALAYGIAMARSIRLERILLPLLDVLQSVPILGFFPAAIFFFIQLFNGSQIGVEVAAVFLIFTSMAWNLVFAVYESIISIPNDVLEAADVFHVHGLQRLRRLFIPASLLRVVQNGIMSWAGGWYFLVAAEIISIGSRIYTLNGLGRFIAEETYAGHLGSAFSGFGMLAILILVVDLLVWHPVETYAERYRTEAPSPSRISLLAIFNVSRLAGAFSRFPASQIMKDKFTKIIRARSDLASKIWAASYGLVKIPVSSIRHWLRILRGTSLLIWVILALFTFYMSWPFWQDLIQSIYSIVAHHESSNFVRLIPKAVLFSMGRLSLGYLIALGWTLPTAIYLARHSYARRIMMPLFQTLAAIPATSWFPFMVLIATRTPVGPELASILLILTGMQWYLLFNLIGGARSIPPDLDECAKVFGLKRLRYFRKLTFPSLYPSLLTGSITAWGGGWNALIVSEYIVFGPQTFRLLGIGALLDISAYELGNVGLIVICVASMSFTIVLLNRLFWRPLLRKIMTKYYIES